MAGDFRDNGFRGSGFHDRDGRGFSDRDFGHRFRFGFFPGYYDDYTYDYPYGYGYDPYAYNDMYNDNGSCHVVQRRVHTAQGWRRQPVQVCG
jgi:hypothetical protein